MSFAAPYFFALLLLLPVFVLLRRRWLRESAAGMYSNVGLLADYRPSWRIRYRWLPSALRVAAVALVVVGLTRPQVGHAESELPGQGIDIALVLDISSSMESSRLGNQNSRLEVAKDVLADFVSGRESDQIALVVFRQESLMLSPLTLDYKALEGLIEAADEVNLADGTGIGVAVGEAVNLLRESRARSRAIVLLTDGQNNNRTVEPLASAHLAKALGIRLYTVGVVDLRPVPTQPGVDEVALQEMAELTDGVYFSAASPEALAAIYESIDALEKSRVSRKQFASYEEIGVYFLAAALALIAIEVLATASVWRRAT